MTKKERFRYEMFIRTVQFGLDNAVDFPAGTIAAVQFGVITSIIAEIQQLIGDQSAGFSDARYNYDTKDTKREDLREEVGDINETARSMVYQYAGVDLKFRMPRGNSDAELLASARAFAGNAAQYEAAMIEYGLPSDFLEKLQTAIDEFEASLSAPGAAIDSHVEATADIGTAVRRGMVAARILDGVVKNKYRSNVGKLAAWATASHIERMPKAKEPIPPVM